MQVSREDVIHCARLAHLQLQEAEIEPLRRDMEQLLNHAERLSALDLEGVEPLLHPFIEACPLREDIPAPSLSQAEALANAPDQERGHFRVPKVL